MTSCRYRGVAPCHEDSYGTVASIDQNPLDTVSRSFPIVEEVDDFLPTCCGLVSDTAKYLDTGQNPLHQFPRNKYATSWREQKSVVSVVLCRFPNSFTTTCFQLAADLFALSLTNPQQVGACEVWRCYHVCKFVGDDCGNSLLVRR